MQIDNITENLTLPLPHPDNDLEDDVLRIADALTAVDAAIHAARQLLAQKANADAVAQAMNLLDGAVQDLQSGKADAAAMALALAGKVGQINGQAGESITLRAEHLALGPANGASAMSVERDGQGRVWRTTSTVGGMPAVQTIAYAENGRVQTITTNYQGRTRVETFTFEGGAFTSMTAEETQV